MILMENRKNGFNQGKDLAVFSEDGTKTFTFRMFHEFNPNRTYLITSDVAEGVGKDASVLYVWDITDTSNIRMCLRFSDSNISILDFAFVTLKIAKMYNNPFLACESNGIALGYIEQLRITYEYENFVRMNRDNGCGIQSHVQVKSRACLWFRDMMTTMGFGFELNDLELIDEMGTFVKKDTKIQNVYAAVGDNHDDHIMTMIWACWILNPENVEKYFVVADTFTSSIGNVFPRTLGSLFDVTDEEIREISEIPQVREFLTYKTLHKEEFEKMEREITEREMNTMRMLGAQTIVSNNPTPNQNRVVYTQDDMLGIRRKPTEGRTVVSQAEVLVQTRGRTNDMNQGSSSMIFGMGSSFSDPLTGFDDDGPMW
jgi:hypothetical protein